MGQALLVVKHPVENYDAWRTVYDSLEPLRQEFGCTGQSVFQDPGNPNEVTVLHFWPSIEAAQGFAGSDGLKEGMGRAGVAGPPRIEIVTEA